MAATDIAREARDALYAGDDCDHCPANAPEYRLMIARRNLGQPQSALPPLAGVAEMPGCVQRGPQATQITYRIARV